MLNCLSGLDNVDRGTIRVGGRDISAMSDADRTRDRASSMGFVFQAFNLNPVFSATENVELPLLLAGASPRAAREAAEAALGRVGLAHRLGVRVDRAPIARSHPSEDVRT
jgi:putative ABC transport system ATP-binding protein